MFGKLKEKLKKSLSIFSKKTQEEAIEETISRPIDESASEPTETTTEIKENVKTDSTKKEETIAETKEEAKEQVKKDIKEEVKIPTEEKITKPTISPKKTKKFTESTSAQDLLEELKEEDDLIISKEEPIEQAPKTKEILKEKEKIDDKILETKIKKELPIEPKKQSTEQIITELKEKEEPKKTEIVTKKPKPELKKVIEEKQELKVITEIKEDQIKQEQKEKPKEEKKSFFSKLKQAITTKKISAEKFEELFWDLEITLLENNVSIKVVEKIKQDLKEELVDKPLPRNVPAKIEETLKKTLTEILSFEKIDLIQKIKEHKQQNEDSPYIITFFGINGSGKTTSIAKLTNYFQKQNLSVVLAAGDTFRAAAIHQLEEHATNLKVKIIKHDYGSDAAAVAFDAVKYAKKNNVDVVLIDTAGRLHSNTNLMQELEKILRTAKPNFKIFVGESITGNDCVEQASKYNEKLGVDGCILTKADVDEQGGAPLSVSYVINKPILFLGTGQSYDDLIPFSSDLILKRLGFED